jgi:hypothetical protein
MACASHFVAEEKNDFLAHSGPGNAPDHSNVFIGAVYIKKLNIYVHSADYGPRPWFNQCQITRTAPRIEIYRAGFPSAGVSKAFLSRNQFKFQFEVLKHLHGSEVQ